MPHQVERVVIPSSVDAPDAADFLACVDVVNACEGRGFGTAELSFSAAERLPAWLKQDAEPKLMFCVRVDGRIVGRGEYEWVEDAADVAWMGVYVHPDYRRRGIASAIADHLEDRARSEGRERLLVYGVSEHGGGEQLPAPTGYGSLPADNPDVRFALGRGYTLEQVVRASRLALPVEVTVPETPGYRIHSWEGSTPERWRADMALLHTRMSTDAPSAGLEEPEDPWTVERLIADEEVAARGPRARLTVVAEHLATGSLAGFSVLLVPPQPERAPSQDDTLVLRDHRGHRLGMALKLANLAALQLSYPGRPGVTTFNAEENRPMLDVNEAIGFVPIGYEGAWKKLL